MWEYRQDLDLQTRLKIKPFCNEWQSACWFLLKGLEIYNSVLGCYPYLILGALVSFMFLVLKRRRKQEATFPGPSLAAEGEDQPEENREWKLQKHFLYEDQSDNVSEETPIPMVKEPVLSHQIESEIRQVFQESFPAAHGENRPMVKEPVLSHQIESEIRQVFQESFPAALGENRPSAIPSFDQDPSNVLQYRLPNKAIEDCIESKSSPQVSKKSTLTQQMTENKTKLLAGKPPKFQTVAKPKPRPTVQWKL
ncbi:uncharacterized protein LOC121404211 isoform X1 [Drosophila obscura]|uniref:uncharacterized protein LOC121404211 isoform X1 n=1 Tax=Drosophila obscura TaxID=7282 RepID=UPI001BB1DD56|nr:uncharacterized protein LOC121404211 isoform X1 [Drosophila obscura]